MTTTGILPNDWHRPTLAPALEVPLRIPSGDEVIPVESGQRETSHDLFLGSREKIIMTRLGRGGVRLPGDES